MSKTGLWLRAAAIAAVGLQTATAPAGAATARPAWWSYDRAAQYGSTYERVRATMRDGVRLGCHLHRPAARSGKAAAGRFPSIVYEVTPYALNSVFYLEQGDYFARRGYNAVMCNVRGTGQSGGRYPQINQPAEATDAYDLVEWIAAQPYADGAVGQTGESYGAMTAYRAAASGAPHLKAVAPQQAPNDLYLDDVYPGGIPAQPITGNAWPLIAGATSFGRANPSTIFATQKAHPRRDAFWRQVAIDGVLAQVDVPVLAFGGWADELFRSGAMRNYERLVGMGREDAYLIYGPWTHGEVIDWKGCRLITLACARTARVPPGALLAWFDHWVAGRTDAPLPTSRVASFQGTVGNGTRVGWRESDGLPQEGAPESTLALGVDGSMRATPGGPGARSFLATPLDGITRRAATLTFDGPALTADTELVGRPIMDLAFASTATDANLHVELRSTAPDGRVTTISEGFLRASHRASHEVPEPLVPGAVARGTVELDPVDLRLPAGSRLGVRIGSGDASRLVPINRAVRVTVRTGSGGSVLRYRSRPAD